jgi:hypothetical protein
VRFVSPIGAAGVPRVNGWRDPRTWATNQNPSGFMFSTDVSDNQLALITGCRALRQGAVTYAGGSGQTPIVFDNTARDPFGMWVAADPTKVTVPIPGVYKIKGRIAGASVNACDLQVWKNGSPMVGFSASTGYLEASELPYTLVAGDYIQLIFDVGASDYNGQISIWGSSALADLTVQWISP